VPLLGAARSTVSFLQTIWFCWYLLNMVFNMRLIGFLLRATKLEVKQALKNKVLCLSRKAKQCLLQMSRNTLAFASDGTSTLMHELV